jgi:hypothetical protein
LVSACAPADEEPVGGGETRVLARDVAPRCAVTQIASPDEWVTTERSAFTEDGRLFIIGTRPGMGPFIGDSWLAEVQKDAREGHRVVNVLPGALEGTSDGTLDGAPRGDACIFSGMASYGALLYAGCATLDGRQSLLQIDTYKQTVRAAYFTSCNAEPASMPCEQTSLYANGMAVDAQGRIYTNFGSDTLLQILVGDDPPDPTKLNFRHHPFVTANFLVNSLSPNGIQIEDDVLYFAAGANLNAVPILKDGTAGKQRRHYNGPTISYIDDFSVNKGSFVLARTIPAELAALTASSRGPKESGTCPLPDGAAPSSVRRQPDLPVDDAVFPPGTLVVTAFSGGGLYTLPSVP